MKMRLALFVLLMLAMTAAADDQVARIQQQLKEQGFYYGEITGEKNADTTAAIRRFQIRNGLQITGELNEETTKALAAGQSSAANRPVTAVPRPPVTQSPSPLPRPDNSDLRDDRADRYTAEAPSLPNEQVQPRQGRPPTAYPGRVVPGDDGNFGRTPYENAPPEVRQDVIARAERKLAKRDLYRGAIDGTFNSDLEFSLQAYQARIGLPTTGRLDLQTLAALELLPGANQPVFVPHRGSPQAPIRGEWVRP
jgi:peptidoglycan hydrolase-like protein with peptidoglycan-binding domain